MPLNYSHPTCVCVCVCAHGSLTCEYFCESEHGTTSTDMVNQRWVEERVVSLGLMSGATLGIGEDLAAM